MKENIFIFLGISCVLIALNVYLISCLIDLANARSIIKFS